MISFDMNLDFFIYLARKSHLLFPVRPAEAHVGCTFAGSLKRNWSDGASFVRCNRSQIPRRKNSGRKWKVGGGRWAVQWAGIYAHGYALAWSLAGFLSALQLFCLYGIAAPPLTSHPISYRTVQTIWSLRFMLFMVRRCCSCSHCCFCCFFSGWWQVVNLNIYPPLPGSQFSPRLADLSHGGASENSFPALHSISGAGSVVVIIRVLLSTTLEKHDSV